MSTPDTHSIGGFPATRGSVLASLAGANAEERVRAWDELVLVYWRPVYKYVRLRWRKSPETAQDLTQGFFAKAIEKDFFSSFDASRARFRTYLRTCLDGYVMNEAKAERALKRGGGARTFSLDYASADRELDAEEPPSPEKMDDYFHAEWVRAVFAAAVGDLRREAENAGHPERFEAFRLYDLAEVSGGERPKYEDVAARLGVPASSLTNWLYQSRARLRELVAARLRAITANDDEFRAEAAALLGGRQP